MRTNASVLALSILMPAMIVVACGTSETFFPIDVRDTASDTESDTSSDTDRDTESDTAPDTTVPPDTDRDTEPDTMVPPDVDVGPDVGPCEGSDPSKTCVDFGCPSGQECVPVEDGCIPSECICGDDGHWICTDDCAPEFECRVPEACPSAEPFGDACAVDGLECSWGTECCCGECFPSLVCTCYGGTWGCYATDACMIPGCEGRACDSDSDCESWEGQLECIAGVCTEPGPGEGGWAPGPDIAVVTDCDESETDSYELNDAAIVGGKLSLTVSYSGGCTEHLFRVCWDGSFAESEPVRAYLQLQHDSQGDVCLAYPTEVLTVDLAPLREGLGTSSGEMILVVDGEEVEYAFE